MRLQKRAHGKFASVRQRRDRAILVGAKKPHTEARVALDHHFRRMSKRVSFAYRSDRDSRHDYRKKLIRRGCFAAVVRNLEEIRGERSAVGDEAVFGLSLDVAGEQEVQLPIAKPDHQ